MITDATEIRYLIYASSTLSDIGEDLQKNMEEAFPNEGIMRCHSVNSFVYTLLPLRSARASNQMCAVIFADTIDELNELLEFSDLLTNINIILILNKSDKKSIEKASAIKPQWITFMDEYTMAEYTFEVIQELLRLQENNKNLFNDELALTG
jgi:hypothetical protein